MTEQLTEQSFDAAIASGTVLVDFWAEWCGPCHALTPILDELSGGPVDAVIAKIDVAEHPAIGERYDIKSLPTLIVFKDGEPVKRMFGVKNKRQLGRAIDEANGVLASGEAAAV